MDKIVIMEACKRPTEDSVLRYTLYRTKQKGYTAFDLVVAEEVRGVRDAILLDDFTDRIDTAERIFHLFAEGDVTVCTAEDILFDLLLSP